MINIKTLETENRFLYSTVTLTSSECHYDSKEKIFYEIEPLHIIHTITMEDHYFF